METTETTETMETPTTTITKLTHTTTTTMTRMSISTSTTGTVTSLPSQLTRCSRTFMTNKDNNASLVMEPTTTSAMPTAQWSPATISMAPVCWKSVKTKVPWSAYKWVA